VKQRKRRPKETNKRKLLVEEIGIEQTPSKSPNNDIEPEQEPPKTVLEQEPGDECECEGIEARTPNPEVPKQSNVPTSTYD